MNIADTLYNAWNYSKPAETEVRFREFLAEATSPAEQAEIRTQLARSVGLQRRFDEAHEILNQADAQITNDMPVVKVRALLERGRVYNSSGNAEQAREYFLAAFEAGKQCNHDDYTVDAAHMMGIITKAEESLQWNELAISIAQNTEQEMAKRWLASLLNNTGWTYFSMGNYTRALELFKDALEFRRKQNNIVEIHIAQWCVAKTLRMLGNVEESLSMQRAMLAERAEKNIPEDGYIYEETGECLLTLGKPDEAKPHFAKAHELLSKDIWLQANEQPRLERLLALSQ
ncbi:MAG: tetratricopeptide repeat protein [Candidatus Kapabacteria bacterium]|nr:tetratricopeptide repeat protein [Candidatus Kapabacteria bacterium]